MSFEDLTGVDTCAVSLEFKIARIIHMEPILCPLTSSLSDEVLLLIIQNLGLVDVINLSQTCRKLDDLLKDRTICENLRFDWQLKIERLDFVKFLRNSQRSALITKLNMNDLYWVPSGIIRNIARPLANLKEFHAGGTNLSWTHLTEILTPARNLQALSWSWDHRIENPYSGTEPSSFILVVGPSD
ncbi:unnamed protein product [Allacma fusca]|uniref:F-box domain-containing protein n=1 Tax=Allacma fusca TaxID=39272 RepID=A0A8J2PUA5_9HEXA|nr:unnamed protein product [Allacma fusca]